MMMRAIKSIISIRINSCIRLQKYEKVSSTLGGVFVVELVNCNDKGTVGIRLAADADLAVNINSIEW